MQLCKWVGQSGRRSRLVQMPRRNAETISTNRQPVDSPHRDMFSEPCHVSNHFVQVACGFGRGCMTENGQQERQRQRGAGAEERGPGHGLTDGCGWAVGVGGRSRVLSEEAERASSGGGAIGPTFDCQNAPKMLLAVVEDQPLPQPPTRLPVNKVDMFCLFNCSG